MTGAPLPLCCTNQMAQRNVQFLPKYIRNQLQQLKKEDLWARIDIIHSNEGFPICRYREDERIVRMNSLEPFAQAKYWCSQLPYDQMGTLFVYGCGFGYPLFELLKNMRRDNKILVFERNIYIFVAMLHYFDLEPIFRSGNFIFFIGDFADFEADFVKLISTPNFLYFTAPANIFTPRSQLFKKEYFAIQQHLFERMVQQISALGNNHYDSLLGFHNMVGNIGEVLKNPYLSSLQDTFKNVPAFIVANGPSLDKNMLELKKVNGKGLILCCESAIVPLMKNGIQPDAICVLERDRESYIYHFENQEYPKEMALLALAVADPRIFSSFSGPKIPVFRNKDSLNLWLNRIIGDGSALYGGSNVAHFAYETAVYLGANPIVFVGQDLAFGPDGVTHSRQSKYADEAQEHIEDLQSLPVVYVEGNDGTRLASIQGWVEFRKGLEQMIEQTSQVTVVNATEGGAKIRGTACDKLTNVIEAYCKDDLPYRLYQLINENKEGIDVQVRIEKLKTLVLELKKGIILYRALYTLTLQKMEMSHSLLERLDQENFSEVRQEIGQVFENNFQEIMKFMSPDLHPSLFQQVILAGYHRLNEIGAICSLSKIMEAIQTQYRVFDHLGVVCQSIVENYRTAVEKILTEIVHPATPRTWGEPYCGDNSPIIYDRDME